MADCPHCHQPLPDDLVIKAGMSALGKRGRGEAKARPSHQCQKAAKALWEQKARRAKEDSSSKPPGTRVPATNDPTS